MARKRVVYRVHYVGREKVWRVTILRLDGTKHTFFDGVTKARATEEAASTARYLHKITGTLTQVVVHTKDGRIAWERTYGQDPKRRKG